jgi:RNA polymerase sigma-70 factor (ECF subfamily)
MNDSFRSELIDAIRPLRAFSRTLIRDEVRAEDLVQETLVKAWEKQNSFQPGTNIRAWLFTILRNTYYSELRKRKREVEDVDGKMTAELSVKAPQDGFMAVRDLRGALEALNAEQREALILVGASGFSYEEAGEICGVAAGTVKSRVSRARQRLADLLGERAVAAEDEEVSAAAGAERTPTARLA